MNLLLPIEPDVVMKNISQSILIIIVFGLILSNGVLIWQNLSLKTQISNQKALIEVKEGDFFNSFDTEDFQGININLDFTKDNRKKVLLYFRTTCSFCKEQMRYWKELVASIDNKTYRVIALTTETDVNIIKNYIKSHAIENWEVLTLNANDAEKAKLSATPITVVVDNQGKVEKAWIGMWRENEIKSASEYFAVDFTKSGRNN